MPDGRVRAKHFPEGILLSFVAIGINIITSIVGVASPDNPVGKKATYGVLLIICFLIFLVYMAAKYFFLYLTWNIKPWCANKCSDDCVILSRMKGNCLYCWGSFCWNWSVAYDFMFCLMALLYLAGDNLEEMVCEEHSWKYCPVTGRVILGVSLMLNILLTLLKSSTKPNFPSTFPVIGVMGNVYSKLLLIAASVMTVDQAVTTVLTSTKYNDTIRSNNDFMIDNTRVQNGAIGIFTVIGAITFFILLFVLVILALVNRRVCCDCKCKKVKWWEMVFGQWLCAACVVFFVIAFIVGDISWIWEFFDTSTVNTPANEFRLSALSVSLVLLSILSIGYICGICFPGVSVVAGERYFFLPKYASGAGMTLKGNMSRKQYNEWVKVEDPDVSMSEGDVTGKIKVEDDFGKTDITFSVDREITCFEACIHWIDGGLEDRREFDDVSTWTVQAYIGKGRTKEMQIGGGKREADDGKSGYNHRKEARNNPTTTNGVEMKSLNKETSIRDNSGASPK